MIYDLTPEEIQRRYNAALDSVNLIHAGKPASMSDSDWADCLSRNVLHLQHMLTRDYWTNEDLTPFTQAIDAAG